MGHVYVDVLGQDGDGGFDVRHRVLLVDALEGLRAKLPPMAHEVVVEIFAEDLARTFTMTSNVAAFLQRVIQPVEVRSCANTTTLRSPDSACLR